MPEGDNGSCCIRGGGLNPCTVDTDKDMLPDPWERQFAGVIFANGSPVGPALPQSAITVINRADGVVTANDRGNAVITASSEDGTVQATCVVSVSELI